MPKIDKYWVFHQGQLAEQLDAYVADAAGYGLTPEQAKENAEVIRHFLAESEAGKSLLGGRVG